MKIYNKYIVLAAMALTFAACTQEDDFTSQTDGDAVKINATIGKLQTRVIYTENGATDFVTDDQICVVNTMRTSKNSATYTLTQGYWTTTDAFVWNGSAKNQFKAWYPAATASFDSFDLPTDQSAGIDKADWMTAETEEMTKPGSGVLDLNFVHKLTKVTVTVSFNSQYPAGDNYVSMFRFFTNEETPVEVTPYESRDGYTAILLPGVYAEEASFITLEMNFEDNLTVPVNSTLIAGLEAGKHYNFHLTVGKDAVGITYVRVLDWDEEEIDGGMAEEVPFEEVSTAEEFTAAIEDGGKIKLMDNITLDDFFVSSDVVLDMNGYDITSKWMFNAEDCSIIISGDGTIKSNEDDPYVNLINAHLKLQGGTMKCTLDVDDGSTITVSGGSIDEVQIRDAIATISGGNIDMLEIRIKGNIYISGGNVSTLGYHGGNLIISGGTFGFDPTSYLAGGYTATENEGIWTVAPSNN